ncbi:MAG: hypothetical protein ACK442_10245 [Novosphingobium sp.]|jgi:hypothetical protein|nr:hypothetical protein [Brevundimonas sp.]MCZ8322627.1 hypothetical protein [Novosphingobium sp.]
MDLNQLFADHQNALLHLARGGTAHERQGHHATIADCARQLIAFRQASGLPLYRWA